jgi:hypothetical protein
MCNTAISTQDLSHFLSGFQLLTFVRVLREDSDKTDKENVTDI